MIHDPDLLDRLDALRLIRADIAAMGVPQSEYQEANLPRTQAIGAAVEFLGCDGLIAPSARWGCENLMLFPERMGTDASLELVSNETVDWLAWGTAQGLTGSD